MENSSHSVTVQHPEFIAAVRANIIGSGTAYVFTKSAGVWSQEQELQPDADGTNRAGDLFGWSVSISSDGNPALLGAFFADCPGGVFGGCGAAYVFVRNAGVWTQKAKLQQVAGDLPGDVGTDDGETDQFGYSVALSGDGSTAVIGARYDDEDGPNSGSVYVFVKNGGAWGLEQKLLRFPVAGDPDPADPVFWGQIANFGTSVGVSNDGDTAVIGAHGIPGPCAGLNLSDCGVAFVFVRNAGVWSEQAEIAADPGDSVFDQNFGFSTAISGDGQTIVVGAPDGNINDPGSGLAFVFVTNGGVWSQQAKLTPVPRSFSGAQCCELFGYSVAISDDGDTVVIGRPEDDVSNALGLAGTAFAFMRNAGVWSNGHLLQEPAADVGQADDFGWSVGVSGDGLSAVVGAPDDDDRANNSGSAFVFGLDASGIEAAIGGVVTLIDSLDPAGDVAAGGGSRISGTLVIVLGALAALFASAGVLIRRRRAGSRL